MGFVLHFPDGVSYPEGVSRFNQHGFLVVDDGERRYTYLPHSWAMIEQPSSGPTEAA